MQGDAVREEMPTRGRTTVARPAQTGSKPLLPMVGGILLVLVGIGAMVLGRPRGTHA
ncbi:hypothetical protein [Longivirga aurantiaca]|uniref:LPXTG cell wall anchor domain-containing protein n=1 Tax=Longivirga aurantiaca TaxID=1837743 RepID=A0ABW1T2H9_9ACTN